MILGVEELEIERPRKLREALALLRDAARAGQPLTPLAGGTDLFVGLNAGRREPKRFLDLSQLHELRGVTRHGRDGRKLSLGALTTYTECRRSKAVAKVLPILQAAAREVGGVQIQNRGTLGGNLGNGSPAADAVPVLAAADAQVILASRDEGERAVPLSRFYTGYRQSVRRPDELIVRIELEVPKGPQRFRKVGPRAAQAISKVVLAAVGDRLAFGSVGPTVLRAHKVEAYLASGARDPEEARRLLALDLAPIDDIRSTADYRLRVAQNLLVEHLRDTPASS